jgi:hypothetical protein
VLPKRQFKAEKGRNQKMNAPHAWKEMGMILPAVVNAALKMEWLPELKQVYDEYYHKIC